VVGFTPIAASQPPEATVEMLSHLFADFDAATERHGLERIKLVGDAYMAVGGLHTGERDHAADATRLALELRILARRHGSPEHGPLQVRIGVCTGPVVAGVIGSHRFQYDLWGNTVNMASHLASHGVPGGIQVAEETRRLLGTQFQFTLREVRIKGRESARVHLLEGECGTQVAIPDTHRDAPAASARPSP
jgi:adenylate cyclase